MSSSHYNLAVGHTQVLDADVRFVSGAGSLLRTHDGREVVDLHNNGSLPLGHDHELLAKAFAEQPPLNIGKYASPAKQDLIARLEHHLPDYTAFQFYSNGTSANEGMLRYAMAITGRSAFVGFHGAFHGHTKALVSVSDMDSWHGERIPTYHCLPYPGYDHMDGGESAPSDGASWLAQAGKALDQIGADRVAGVIMEPILGKILIRPPAQVLSRFVTEVLRPRGILFLADEYMTSVRTGRWLAAEEQAVRADVVTFGKSVKTGVPFAALACRSEFTEAVSRVKGEDSASGQPAICRAVELTIDRLDRDNLIDRVWELGEIMTSVMRPLLESGHLTRVADHGALLGIELPTRARAVEVADRALAGGVLTAAIRRVIRMTPALNIGRPLFRDAMTTVRDAVIGSAS